jgi:hypothetical protein
LQGKLKIALPFNTVFLTNDVVLLAGEDNVTPSAMMFQPLHHHHNVINYCTTYITNKHFVSSTRLTLLEAGEPTVNEDSAWKYQTAFGLPWASSVRSPLSDFIGTTS